MQPTQAIAVLGGIAALVAAFRSGKKSPPPTTSIIQHFHTLPQKPATPLRVSPLANAPIPMHGSRAYLAPRSPTHWHRGIDMAADLGAPVVAAQAGTVTHASSEWQQGFGGYGRHVVIRHGAQGPWTLYGHLETVAVIPGQQLATGQPIGTVGTTLFPNDDKTGRFHDSPPHLHFEVAEAPYPLAKEAPRVDPGAWLRALGVA